MRKLPDRAQGGRPAREGNGMIDSGSDAGRHQPPLNTPPPDISSLDVHHLDIETIYSSVTMQGAKYRDFSASRQEIRSRFRRRVLLKQRIEAAGKAREQSARAQAVVLDWPAGSPQASEARTQEEIPESADAPAQAVAPVPPQEHGVGHGLDEEEAPSLPGAALTDREEKNIPEPEPVLEDGASGLEDEKRNVPSADCEIRESNAASNEATAGGDTSAEGEASRYGSAVSASRWFALRSIRAGDTEQRTGVRVPRGALPALAIFSQAGGVGKTSLVATLGRVLAARGEQTLLAEIASPGLLPLFFGSREVKAGIVRTFSPPAGSEDAAVRAVSLDPQQFLEKKDTPDWVAETLLRYARGSNRLLIDIQTGSKAIAHRLLPLVSIVLVPLLPDMNSVVSLTAVEAIFADRKEASPGAANREQPGSQLIEPVYLLNQFDGTLPLHVEVRGRLQEQLGERLLPFVVRRSAAVSEALAEGMTVVDYAPQSAVAEDYIQLADWLANAAPVPASGLSGLRWSER